MGSRLPEDQGSEMIAKALGSDPVAEELLLPGELPDSTMVEDAEHWITVYVELIQTAKRLNDGGGAFVERYQRRLSYWLARRQELGPHRGGE